MADMMTFPDTVEEFMEQYKMIDKEQIYSNGIEYVPMFRMRQWFEHLKNKADVPDMNVGEKTCKTCHLWEDGELNIACPWGSNYEHYEDDYCSLWEKQN